jgi:predicted  nucleic acid-binding Zn-ribbon protein
MIEDLQRELKAAEDAVDSLSEDILKLRIENEKMERVVDAFREGLQEAARKLEYKFYSQTVAREILELLAEYK